MEFSLTLTADDESIDLGYGVFVLARDGNGRALDIDADGLEVILGDEIETLNAYIDTAESEVFEVQGRSFVPGSTLFQHGHWIFQVPAQPDVERAATFALENLRCWAVGTAWDGITLVRHALADERLNDAAFDAIAPDLTTELRFQALSRRTRATAA
jgi:hypothetical protein